MVRLVASGLVSEIAWGLSKDFEVIRVLNSVSDLNIRHPSSPNLTEPNRTSPKFHVEISIRIDHANVFRFSFIFSCLRTEQKTKRIRIYVYLFLDIAKRWCVWCNTAPRLSMPMQFFLENFILKCNDYSTMNQSPKQNDWPTQNPSAAFESIKTLKDSADWLV